MDSKVVQWVTRSTPLESRGAWKRFVQERKGFDDGGRVPQLVQPGPGRQGYKGNPEGNPLLGTKYTGTQHKGKIFGKNKERLDKLKELIQESNNSYTKNLTSHEILVKAGWKDGYQSIGTYQKIRPEVKKAMKKFNTIFEKMDAYVLNVMLAEDALVKDFRNPQQHLAKKFGVSRGTVDNWANGTRSPLASGKWKGSKVWAENKKLFKGLGKELSFNKYKLLPDGTPRLMSDYSEIVQNKLPSSEALWGADDSTRFIQQSAKRNYLQNKALGKEAKVTFITDPTITPQNQWQFIDNETGRLFSTDPAIDVVEFQGKTYKNNYLNHADAAKLYKKEFGNIYKIYNDDLVQYMNAMVVGKDGKPIKLDDALKHQAFEKSKTIKNPKGKKDFLKRRFVDVHHEDLLNDPFGRKKGNLRLLDRQTNVKAGLIQRFDKYKKNPELLKKTLTDMDYFIKDKDTASFIERMTKKAGAKKTLQKKIPLAGSTGVSFLGTGALDDWAKNTPEGRFFKKSLSGLRKVGAELEAGFIALDYMNNISKGDSPDVAFKSALQTLSLDLYKGGDRKRRKEFIDAAVAQGISKDDPRLKGALKYYDINTNYAKLNKLKKQLYEYETSDDPLAEISQENIEGKKKQIADLEKIIDGQVEEYIEIAPQDFDPQKFFDQNVEYIAAQKLNKTLDDRAKRVNPEMGTIGSDLWESISDWRTYLPQNLMETGLGPVNVVTRPVVRGLRKLPGIVGDIWDPTSEAAKLSAMTPEKRKKRIEGMGYKEATYDPRFQTWNLPDPYLQGVQSLYPSVYENYAGGGIAGIRRPHAIPPKSGPMPQGGGLSSMFNRVRKW